jgi:hypothetical protein
MQSFTFSKTVRLAKMMLLVSPVFLAPFTPIEAAPLYASPCMLAWNYSQDPIVVGYALYYGITGSAVTNRFDAGMTNCVTFYNLLAGSNYFFFATTYNATGVESPPSQPVHYCPRALSALKLTEPAGATMNLQFEAAPGSACHVEYTPSLTPPQWQTLASATADTNGNVMISDPLAGNPPTRFYRAVLP